VCDQGGFDLLDRIVFIAKVVNTAVIIATANGSQRLEWSRKSGGLKQPATDDIARALH